MLSLFRPRPTRFSVLPTLLSHHVRTLTIEATRPPRPDSDVVRTNLGIFGDMNAGKSTLMNALTLQYTSIVDAKPGTTADVKTALMEFHGLGPVKLMDTAGLDEKGLLGSKKRAKTLAALKESDVVILVVDALAKVGPGGFIPASATAVEQEVIDTALSRGRTVLVVFNTSDRGRSGSIVQAVTSVANQLTPGLKSIMVDLNSEQAAPTVLNFVTSHFHPPWTKLQVLPNSLLGRDRPVFMNVPMDAETPKFRLLRPQAAVQEHCLRNFTPTLVYRMDLNAGRSNTPQAERTRFIAAVDSLKPITARGHTPLVVTDSQAIDLVHTWTMDKQGKPICDITTFSVAMINMLSGGQLKSFVDGLDAFDGLGPGDRVLIAEACNHNRIPDQCDDIGVVQIPNKIKNLYGSDVQIEHAFGREFPTAAALRDYSLVIHCGGCMVDYQKIRSRMEDCNLEGVPITNYGLLLSHLKSKKALKRVVEPFVH